jgi:hypothetical protein
MIGNQIDILTFSLSFGHNLGFKYPNGSCEPILNISVLRFFQWYKELFNPMSCDSYNYPLKIQEPIGILIPKKEVHLRMWGFVPSHSPTLLRAWNVTPELHSWLTSLQTFALVTSPRLRLQHFKSFAVKGSSRKGSPGVTFHTPGSARECKGMKLHTPKWVPTLGVRVSMYFQIFKEVFQGSKFIGLKSSLYH